MNNVILIIGASSDIALSFIEHIDEDCLILAHYNKSKDKLFKLSQTITNKMIMIKADLSKEDEIISMIDNIEQNYDTPNKILHLPSIKFENIRFKDIQWENFELSINIALKSLVLILNKFLPKLAKKKYGKIVVVLSSSVLGIPPKALSYYVTTKYAMLGLVKSLSSEYADKNIQINAISPSMTETKFLNSLNSKIVELNAYNHPLKRNAHVNDISPIIKMLLSKESDYINGANIPITGGGS